MTLGKALAIAWLIAAVLALAVWTLNLITAPAGFVYFFVVFHIALLTAATVNYYYVVWKKR